MKSLGFFEVESVAAAVDALDLMCKAADVNFVTWERKLGGRLVTIIIEGQVSAVTAAIQAAEAACIKDAAATAVIANPHSETMRMVALSASRLAKKSAKKEAAPKEDTYIKEV